MNNTGTIRKYYEYGAWLCVLLILSGILFSRALSSIGMASVFSLAVLHPDVLTHIRIFFKSPFLRGFSLVFLIYLLSGLYSDNLSNWWLRVNTKLAFVALPFGLILLKNQSLRSFHWLLYLFFWMATITSVLVLINYLKNFEIVNLHYSLGQVMETPYSHVRFSLIICFAVFVGWYLYQSDFQPLFREKKIPVILALLFLILFLHILAVRSGLIAFYLCSIFILIRYIYIKRNWQIVLPVLALILILPFLSYRFLPSFKEKIHYMRYDLETFFKDKNTHGLSDAARILSIQNGIKLGERNLLLGVGVGDLQQEMNRYYTEFPDIPSEKRLPHNQFVFVFAAMGIIGLLVFCRAIFLPLFYRRSYMNPLFVCLNIIIISSCLTEATFEEQIGTCFYLVFILLFYNQFIQEK